MFFHIDSNNKHIQECFDVPLAIWRQSTGLNRLNELFNENFCSTLKEIYRKSYNCINLRHK